MAFYWTTTETSVEDAKQMELEYSSAIAGMFPVAKKNGTAVRCLKNDPVGIMKTEQQLEVDIFPTIVSEEINIKNQTGEKLELSIFNSTGSLCVRKSLEGVNDEIDITGLPNGIYVVKIAGDNGVKQQKIIKQ